MNILQDDGSHNEYHQTGKQLDLVVTNLVPDTQYKVKVRAKSTAGTGPWSEIFNGRTLKEGKSLIKCFVATVKIPTYSRTSGAQTLMACLPRQFGTCG